MYEIVRTSRDNGSREVGVTLGMSFGVRGEVFVAGSEQVASKARREDHQAAGAVGGDERGKTQLEKAQSLFSKGEGIAASRRGQGACKTVVQKM
jgi:hypothetical protein